MKGKETIWTEAMPMCSLTTLLLTIIVSFLCAAVARRFLPVDRNVAVASLSRQDLETRITALEKGATFAATQEAIRSRETGFLAQLRAFKADILKEQEANKGSGSSSEEVAALKEENAKLKAQLTKQEYRIGHLVAGMEEMLAARE